MEFKEQLPVWKAEGVTPPETIQNKGWKVGDRPPADVFNWLHNRTYTSLEELRESANKIEEDTQEKIDILDKEKWGKDELVIGGRNYISNSKPSSLDGWTNVDSPPLVLEDGYILAKPRTEPYPRIRYNKGETLSFNAGYYILSYDYYSTGSFSNVSMIDWRSIDFTSRQNLKKGWQRVSDLIFFESSKEVEMNILWYIHGDYIKLKNIKFEKGNIPTDWSPSLEDYVNLQTRVRQYENVIIEMGGTI